MTTPKTWAPNVRPTPEQLAVWLQDATHEERVEFAQQALEAQENALTCFMLNHDRLPARVAHLQATLIRVRALADEWEHPEGVVVIGTGAAKALRAALSAPLTAPDATNGPQGHRDAAEAPSGELLPLPVAFREMAENIPASHLDPLTWRTAMEVAARICEEAR